MEKNRARYELPVFNPHVIKKASCHCLRLLTAIVLGACYSNAIAKDPLSEQTGEDAVSDSISQKEQYKATSEKGIEIGALIVIGVDFRVFYRKLDSPWLFGFRYLDTEDDFVNESVVGLPGDESDRELKTTSGLFINYLFNHQEDRSFYVSGALYNTTNEIQCGSESASDSATSLYFGGGYRKFMGEHLGFKIGLLMSPFVDFEQTTSTCSSESNGDIDLDLSLVIRF